MSATCKTDMNPQITACLDLYSEMLGFQSESAILALGWAYYEGLISRQEEAELLMELGYPSVARAMVRQPDFKW